MSQNLEKVNQCVFNKIDYNPFDEFDVHQTRYRMDDTINILRKSNLSVDYNLSPQKVDEDLEFHEELEGIYGKKLIQLFKEQFETCMEDGKYTCNAKDCKIPFLKANSLEDSYDLEDNSKYLGTSFSHSFRVSSQTGNNEKLDYVETGQEYLKNVIKVNMKIKDFSDFYNGCYHDSGIINAYLRLLDVYSDFSIANREFLNPNQKFQRIKIFETDILDEFYNEVETGIISNALDDELQNLFENHLLLIPIFVYFKSNIIERKHSGIICSAFG